MRLVEVLLQCPRKEGGDRSGRIDQHEASAFGDCVQRRSCDLCVWLHSWYLGLIWFGSFGE